MVIEKLIGFGSKAISKAGALFKSKPQLLIKTEKELAGKSPEELVSYAQFMGEYFAEHRNKYKEFYMPAEYSNMQALRDMWETYKPKKFYEKVWAVSSPGVYQAYKLWKLPLQAHKKLNSVLDSATAACMVIPGTQEVVPVASVLAAVSYMMYGLKSDHPNSGKHVTSGLVKIIDSTKDLPQFQEVHNQAKSFLEQNLLKFNPAKVAA